MTAAQLCARLAALPPEQPVAARVDAHVDLLDDSGDRVSAYFSGIFDIASVCADGEIFYQGQGFLPAALLEIGEEV